MSKISKEIRLTVWNKYDKKCAYCGCYLSYDKMKIDHIIPKYRGWTNLELSKYGKQKGKDKLENLNPSCGSCNSSKSTFSIEQWRKQIENKKKIIFRDSSTFRILNRFGIVSFNDVDVIFHFEKFNDYGRG